MGRILGIGVPLLVSASAALFGAGIAVTTHHNDFNRTGANVNETVLNTSNVNVSTFGKLFSRSVDGQIYAQPLYVPNVSIAGQGVHNVIYVCTEHNSVYAYDADVPAASTPLWRVNLGPSLPAPVIGSTRDLLPEIGVTGTPIIDLPSNTLYVVAETYESNNAIFRLHALDITSGSEKFNGPVVIQGSVPGTGGGSLNGVLAFNPLMHWQRPGLLLWNGKVYIGFGSHQDSHPYHGWLFGYNATTLQQVAIRCLSPNAESAGVWQGGVGLTVDTNGFIYLQTGDGAIDATSGGADYGDSVVKLNTSNGLAIVDYFSPSNQAALAAADADFGSSGPLLIPGTSLAVSGGKDGKLFLYTTSNLGQFHTTDQVVQEWQATYSLLTTGAGGLFAGNVFYNSTLYAWGRRDILKAWAFNGATFNTTPVSQSAFAIPDGYSNEPAMSLSANGTTAGTAILWATYSSNGGADGLAYPGILRAFDASDLTKELWNSNQNNTRDYSGSWAKWCPPTIVNGKVYLGTFDHVLNVYGLIAPVNTGTGSLLGSGNSTNTAMNLTTEGSADWLHWGDTSLNRKAGVAPQLSNYTPQGGGAVLTYSNDPRPLNWSDGAPVVSSTNNTSGVYVSGTGNGFSFTAPADTGTRTLTVHVGGWSSGGTLTAHLSDSSAIDFVDNTAIVVGQYDRNYTLTYKAGSSGQTLTVIWVLTSGGGNVTLNGAALTISSGPATITATAGAGQSAIVNTAFGTPLQATVKDALGSPVSGVVVTFTAPASGQSGKFNGSLTATATTSSTGVATAPAFTANAIVGSYAVTASVAGVASPASFGLTNNPAPATGGAVRGSGNSTNTLTNLTTEGSTDWVHWGDSALNRKAGVTPQISSYKVVGSGTVLTYANDPRPLSWTDGTPTASSASNFNGLYIPAIGNGFSLSAPADAAVRTLTVHVGGWYSGGTLTAHLSDASAPDFVDTTAYIVGQYDRNYTLTYNAGTPAQTLTVTWTMTSGTGNVTLNGAALVMAASIAATGGTPQSATVKTVFAGALQAAVKDANSNPVGGVTVTFTAPASGPSGTFGGSVTTTAVTDNNGLATAAAFTANATAGSYSVTATVSGLAAGASFSLTNNPGLPASVKATGGTPQSTTVKTAFPGALQATVQDANSNPVGGVTVTFTPPGSGASGSFGGSATAVTNNNGVAAAAVFTANSIAGSYSVAATVSGVAAGATFSLTNNAGPPAVITATGGTPQSTTVNTAFAGTLQATVRDANGNPAGGVTVTFTAPATGPSAAFNGSASITTVTNGSGVAIAPALTANSVVGSYAVTAKVSSIATGAGFNLINVAGAPASIAATGGTPQNTSVNTTFALPLQATVKDAANNAVAGVTVMFLAPSAGPSATFSGSASATAVTNSSGVAIAPPMAANSSAGAYTVAASVPGVSTPANFSLTNNGVVASGGSLLGIASSTNSLVNLTMEGGADWVHWGDTSLNRKAGVTPQLTSYVVVGSGAVLTYGNDPRPVSWTDGSPTAVSANNFNGIYINSVGNGFSFTAPAGTGSRTLAVHVGGWFSGGTLTAHLSDGSAPDFVDTTATLAGQYDRNYTLTYFAGSTAQTLTVTWKMTSGTGNVTLNGAALATPLISGSGSSASTASSLTTEGGTDWVHWGDTSLNRKAGVPPRLSSYSVVGSGTVLTYSNDPRSLSWTDGAPTASSANNFNGIYIFNVANGFSFTAPADTGSRTLVVHVGGWYSGGTLTAHLSDGSAPDFVDTTPSVFGQYDRNYTLTYVAGSTAQTLTVTWKMASGTGNVTLNAAALQ